MKSFDEFSLEQGITEMAIFKCDGPEAEWKLAGQQVKGPDVVTVIEDQPEGVTMDELILGIKAQEVIDALGSKGAQSDARKGIAAQVSGWVKKGYLKRDGSKLLLGDKADQAGGRKSGGGTSLKSTLKDLVTALQEEDDLSDEVIDQIAAAKDIIGMLN